MKPEELQDGFEEVVAVKSNKRQEVLELSKKAEELQDGFAEHV